MRDLSLHLSDTATANVSGINRSSSTRGSIRISPPIAPPNGDVKTAAIHPIRSQMSQMSHNGCDDTSVGHNGVQNEKCDALSHCIDATANFPYSYYDSNNYYSHVKCQTGRTMAMNQSNEPNSSTAINNQRSHSRGSLEDHGVDVGRVSPSSSSNDSRKSRYSTASLDSGRGSDVKTSGQSHRVSVHSCESLGSSGSHKDIYNRNSSSSSSIGSSNSATVESETSVVSTPSAAEAAVWNLTNGSLSIAEMVLHGIADTEIIHFWLSKIQFEEYANNFIKSGYDMPTISRMTPEDLTAIGITKPAHRRALKAEIQRLNIADGIPNYKPNTLLEWLKILRLDEYYNILVQQGYDSIDRVTELAWEDLEEVGIKKLGHQKKIMLAIKRILNVNNSKQTDANNTSAQIYGSTAVRAEISGPSKGNYQLPLTQCQDVPIKMFAPTKSSPSPTAESPVAPQLKTFQQLPNNQFFSRQTSGTSYSPSQSDALPFVFQASRGRSLESLDNNELNYQLYAGKHHNRHTYLMPFTDVHYNGETDRTQGYETDSELNNYNSKNAYSYEIDGTATLHRPKGLIKAKPIAKIAAKTRQAESNLYNPIYFNDQKGYDYMNESFDKRATHESDNGLHNNRITDQLASNYFEDLSHSQLYASLKRKKTPPPPPKRVNSMLNANSPKSPSFYSSPAMNYNNQMQVNHERRDYAFDEFQEHVFAKCVKSLTSKFSMTNCDESNCSPISSDSEFPPPPSPLPYVEYHKDAYNTLQRRPKKDTCEREPTISSSSSTESMPFANDNIGTIKQNRVNNDVPHRELNSPPSSSHSPITASPSPFMPNICSSIVSPDSKKKFYVENKSSNVAAIMSPTSYQNKKLNSFDGSKMKSPIRCESVSRGAPLDPLDDIETMLVNLSNQLDLMLVNDSNKE